jgi:tetratricopeptide (TPR) repeat protein
MSSKTTTQGLRCLSIHQPWAWLICAGAKQIENRTWKTPYRGTIAIHASTSQATAKAFLDQCTSAPHPFALQDFAFGAIIGLADIIDVQVFGRDHEGDVYASGPYCWRMANPRLLKKPIPLSGKLNLFELDGATSAKVLSADSYRFERDARSREAALTQIPIEVPSLPDRYNYVISELEGKIPDADLVVMASRMIELAPQNPLGYMHRISLQDTSSSETLLRADFEKLVEIAESLTDQETENFELTLSFCAAQLSDENREEQASRFWRQLIHFDGENAWYRRGLGKSLLANSATYDEAIQELEYAIELSDDEDYDEEDVAYLLSTLAEGYRLTNQLDRARETVEQAMKLDRDSSDACFVAARIAIDSKDNRSARSLLKKALILDPDFSEAEEILKQLP